MRSGRPRVGTALPGYRLAHMPLASKIELPERYRVARHIASGGMASVWEAEDLLLGRVVAVKVLGAQYASDPAARARFQREARTAAQVSDQSHVVTIYDIGEHHDDAFIVMEYFAGGTVADRLRAARKAGERVPHETALRWLSETANGLDVAHAAGIVHRDVKPANLLLDAQGRLAVADFGIARLADDTQMTQTGQVLGTAAYISPEQAMGMPATAASDRYALAIVAYELLTGSRPFSGGPPTAQALQHAQEQPPRASQASPELPAAVDPVFARALAKDPDARPATATEFVEGLAEALDEETAIDTTRPIAPPVPVKPVQRLQPMPPVPGEPPVERVPKPAPVAAAVAAPRAPARPEPAQPRPAAPGRDVPAPAPVARRQSPWGAIVAAGMLAAAVFAIVLALTSGDDDPRTSAQGDRTSTSSSSSGQRSSTTASGGQQQTPATAQPKTTASTSAKTPSQLNDEGHRLIQAGNPGGAVAPLQASVKGYQDAGKTGEIGYAFALFNLGQALNRSGNPEAAVAILRERLKIPNQTPRVQAELDDALAKLDGGTTADADNGNGKANGKAKKNKDADGED